LKENTEQHHQKGREGQEKQKCNGNRRKEHVFEVKEKASLSTVEKDGSNYLERRG
jgi:hypothetical protein